MQTVPTGPDDELVATLRRADDSAWRLGSWTIRPITGAGVRGMVARLELPSPQQLRCVISGLELEATDPPRLRVVGPVSMRTDAQRVSDPDAALGSADALFDRLVALAGLRPGDAVSAPGAGSRAG